MILRRGAATVIVRSRHPFIPITISSSPTTLTKAEKWYQIPDRRAHFRIEIGDSIDPSSVIVDGEAMSLARRSEEHTSELQSLMRSSYAVFCLKKKNTQHTQSTRRQSRYQHTTP